MLLAILLLAVIVGCGNATPTQSAHNVSTSASESSTQPAGDGSADLNSLAQQLESDIQAVESAETVGDLSTALAQLKTDVAAATAAGSSGNATLDAELRQALSALNNATAALDTLAKKSTQPTEQSPLHKADSASNPVKDIFDEINTGYDLLEKVVKDLIALKNAVTGKKTPAPASTSGTTGTKAPTATATSTSGTYHLHIVNTNLLYGAVTAIDIKCGGGETGCDADEKIGVGISVQFTGKVYAGVQYWVSEIYSSPQVCDYPDKLPHGATTCHVSGPDDTTITVTWVPKSNATKTP